MLSRAFILIFFVCFSFFGFSQEGIKIGVGADDVKQSIGTEDWELAQHYYQQEDYEKALVYFKKLTKKRKDKRLYDLGLNSYLALNQYKEARSVIKNYIKHTQGRQGIYYADLVGVYQIEKKDGAVNELMEELVEKMNANPNLAYSFGDAFQKKGYPNLALQIYEAAEAVSGSVNFDYQKSQIFGELGQIESMYSMYVKMVVQNPNYMPTIKQLLGMSFNQGIIDEQVGFFTELLVKEIQAGGPATLNELLVFVFIRQENYTGAFLQLKALDKRNPGNKSDLYELAKVCQSNEAYEQAQEIYRYIIKAGSDYAYYELALILELETSQQQLLKSNDTQKSDWQSLELRYQKAFKHLKGTPYLADWSMGLADVLAFRLGKPDSAVGVLKGLFSNAMVGEKAIALAKIKLGDILLFSGDRWEAILMYGQAEKAFEQSPIGQEAKFKKAKAAYYVGDFEWAQSTFNVLKESTSKLIANDAMSYSLLITDNTALDTNTEALEMYAKADLLLYRQQYDSVNTLLSRMDIAFGDHPILDDVLFMQVKVHVELREYLAAADKLETLLTTYPKSILADNALYQLAGLYEVELAQKEKASELYQQLFIEHTDSFFAADARKRFRELRGDVLN